MKLDAELTRICWGQSHMIRGVSPLPPLLHAVIAKGAGVSSRQPHVVGMSLFAPPSAACCLPQSCLGQSHAFRSASSLPRLLHAVCCPRVIRSRSAGARLASWATVQEMVIPSLCAEPHRCMCMGAVSAAPNLICCAAGGAAAAMSLMLTLQHMRGSPSSPDLSSEHVTLICARSGSLLASTK